MTDSFADIEIKIDEINNNIYYETERLKELHGKLIGLIQKDDIIEDLYEIENLSKEIKNTNKGIIEKNKEIKKLKKELNPATESGVRNWIKRFRSMYPDLFTLVKESLDVHKARVIKELCDKIDEYKKVPLGEKKEWEKQNLKAVPVEYKHLIIDGDKDYVFKLIEYEFDYKLYDLMYRVEDRVGKVSDFDLKENPKGGLDGWLLGDKGKVTLNTIPAGGYNIQRFHYRTILK